jgi:hypothetical protein
MAASPSALTGSAAVLAAGFAAGLAAGSAAALGQDALPGFRV